MNIAYPDLPISRRRNDILAAMREHQVIVVVGETGSGKTTQLPKMAMELAGEARGRVGCTQPRRLAAASVSRRVAEELNCGLGGLVGYQVRFEEKAGLDTRLKFMTDGILLAETQHDPDLRQYHTLILDEAHERSLNIDFLLGYLRLCWADGKTCGWLSVPRRWMLAGFPNFWRRAYYSGGRPYLSGGPPLSAAAA